MTIESPTKEERKPGQLDVRGRTITTAIVFEAHGTLTGLAVGDELELVTDRFPALVPDLEAWCRTAGHELVDARPEGEAVRVRLRKGAPQRSAHRVAVVISNDGLEELLSPLGFALAAALGGAEVAV